MDKAKINYPCNWAYTVISNDSNFLKNDIAIKLNDTNFKMKLSNQSAKGKYTSFNVEAFVKSDEERINIFNILKRIPSVKIVI